MDKRKTDKSTAKTSSKGRSRYSISSVGSKPAALDPRLEALAKAAKEGESLDQAFVHSTGDGRHLVDVIVKVQDASVEVPKLNVVTSVQQIITGTVDIEDLENVAAHNNVVKLERGKRIYSDLHDTVREIRARAADLQKGLPAKGPVPNGKNVIVGIIDFGCDFLHENFRNSDGSTRIKFLWNQSGAPSSETPAPQPYGYGREISAAIINDALAHETDQPLAANNPFHPEDFENGAYTYLGYRPSFPTGLPNGGPAHGTHVMDIAAGNGRGSGFPGVAPGADLIFVQLGSDGRSPETESFGNSVRLLQAVDYIFRRADELGRPAVVNMSLGTHGGPHDGSTPAEQHFDGLLTLPNRAIVLSGGNSHRRQIHASGTVSRRRPRTLTWDVQNTIVTDNELEVWYSGADELEATLIDPDGFEIGPFVLGQPEQHISINGQVVAIVNHGQDADNNDNHIDFYFFKKPVSLSANQALPAGQWRVSLSSSSNASTQFHSWIERTHHTVQSNFSSTDADPTHTIGSISCGQKTIVVGAYNARPLSRPIASFSAEGPTRDGRQKPEVSAPGGEVQDGVLAARSLTHKLLTPMPGTSMAAPHVAGVVALILEAANDPLSIDQIRDAITATARQNSASGSGWHTRFGFGRIDALAAVQSALQVHSEPIATATNSQIVAAATSNGHNGDLAAAEAELVERLTTLAARSRVRVRLQVDVEPYG